MSSSSSVTNGDGTGSIVELAEGVDVGVFEAGKFVGAVVSSPMLDGQAVGVTTGTLDEASVGIMVGVLDREKAVGVTVDGTEGVAEVGKLVGDAGGAVLSSWVLGDDDAVGFTVCSPEGA